MWIARVRAGRRTRAKKTHGRLGALWTSIYTPAAYESPDPPMCTRTNCVPSENILEKRLLEKAARGQRQRKKTAQFLLDRLLSFLSLEARLSTTQRELHPLVLSLQREGQFKKATTRAWKRENSKIPWNEYPQHSIRSMICTPFGTSLLLDDAPIHHEPLDLLSLELVVAAQVTFFSLFPDVVETDH